MSTVLAATRLGHPLLGVLIPAAVFVLSFALSWLLYRHFSRRPPS
jgi:hypothetical protein